MGDVVLLTGGTGFLGTEVAARLLERADLEIVSLVLADTDAEAVHASNRAWWYPAGPARRARSPDPRDRRGRRQADGWVSTRARTPISASASPTSSTARPTCGSMRPSRSCAPRTSTGWRTSSSFARSARRLARLVHVSTAYVAGGRKGTVSEDDLTDAFGFGSPYEQTKYEAECLVRDAASELPVTVVRPSMIVGDSRTGDIKTFNTFYTPLRLFLSGKLRIVPAETRPSRQHRAGRLRRGRDRQPDVRPARRGDDVPPHDTHR